MNSFFITSGAASFQTYAGLVVQEIVHIRVNDQARYSLFLGSKIRSSGPVVPELSANDAPATD
jgi:hypothetical protein